MLLATVNIEVEITDTIALWHAAAVQSVKDGAFSTIDEYRAEYGEDDHSNHLRMLLDKGTPPDAGFDIIDSSCEVIDDE